MTDPFFSIVIPTYNRADRIGKTINSVQQQLNKDYEIIIIDDGSTDNTGEVVSQYLSKNVIYRKIANSERGFARNRGIDLSRGKYITFLDSDDIYYPEYLNNAFESIVKQDYPEFLHLAYEIKDESGRILQQINGLQNNDISIFIKGNPLSCLGIFLKRTITDRYRFVEDRSLAGSEDWELWIRVAANYGLKTDNRISAALIAHTERSVLKSDREKLISRKLSSLKYAFSDKIVAEKFTKTRSLIEAHCDSYIALHLALLGDKKESVSYLIRSLKNNLSLIREKRFYSIIKHLIVQH